jgi:hypothetical protein
MVGRPFPCTSCQTQLQAIESCGQIAVWVGVLVSIGVFYVAGLRGLSLAFAGLTGFVPVVYIVVYFLKYFVPPRIQTYLPKDSTLRLRD